MWRDSTSSPRRTVFMLGVFCIFAVSFVQGNKTHSEFCVKHLFADSGRIAYPTSTHLLSGCIWVIESTKDRLQLTFSDLVLKTTCCSCVHDFVEIRDGKHNSSALIGRYCANSSPSKIFSTGKYLWIKFVSDFKASDQNRMRVLFQSLCGQHVVGYAGQISSFSSNSEQCIYSVAVPYHRIRLKFSSLNIIPETEPKIHCYSNYLLVGEVLTEINTVLEETHKKTTKYCLSNPIPNIYSTYGKFLWFKFVDTPSTIKFKAHFTVLLSGESRCKDNHLEGVYGTIISPGYPFWYPSNERCTWVIKGPPNKHIHLVFNTFDFGKGDGECQSNNAVVIYSSKENSSDDDLIGRYCSQDVPAVIISESNIMKISSFSKLENKIVGFSAQFFALDKGICKVGEFKCKNRKCIPFDGWCDGITDCQDASDETDCLDVQQKNFSFQWYKVWPITIIIAMLVMIVWLWRTGRRTLLTHISNPQFSASLGNISDYTLPDENLAPPAYSETGDHVLLSGKLPSYEEAVCVSNDTNQTPATEAEVPLILVNSDGTVVSYSSQRQQPNVISRREGGEMPAAREGENIDSV